MKKKFPSIMPSANKFRLAVFLLALTLGLTAAPAFFPPSAQAAEQLLQMDFKDADIQTFIKFISEATGRNFVVDPAVKGKITVYSPLPVSKDEAYATFLAVLRVHGYAVAQSGSVSKIIPSKEGLGQDGDVRVGLAPGTSTDESLVTQIVPLENTVATEMVKIIPNVLGKDYIATAYPTSNILIMTAPRANIRKALLFIEQAEKNPRLAKPVTVPLRHGDAKTLADNMGRMLKTRDEDQGRKGQPTSSSVQADERTNSLVVYSDAEGANMVRQTIAGLDVPTPKGKGDVHLISLSNAKAEDIATVLNTLVERQRSGAQTDGAKDVVLSRDIKVVADVATNSLVVTARPDEFEAIRAVVAKLDIVRKQVFIEALIMEASSTAKLSFGVNWAAGGKAAGSTSILGGASLGGGSIGLSADRLVSMPSGGSLGMVISEAFSVGGTFYSIQSVISAIQSNNDVDILATPQLLTLDNEPASVEVVDNVPFTKESTTKNDMDFTTQSVDYKDVGVKLKITPRISADGSMRLEVEQEVSRVTQSTVTLSGGSQMLTPTTRKRYVKTTILMQDGQTAVIAGLLSDDSTHNENKVPFLGDIPVVGWLFKSRTRESAKTNLFIFITPHVIRSREDSDTLTTEKKVLLHQTTVGQNGLAMPAMSEPKLPPLAGIR